MSLVTCSFSWTCTHDPSPLMVASPTFLSSGTPHSVPKSHLSPSSSLPFFLLKLTVRSVDVTCGGESKSQELILSFHLYLDCRWEWTHLVMLVRQPLLTNESYFVLERSLWKFYTVYFSHIFLFQLLADHLHSLNKLNIMISLNFLSFCLFFCLYLFLSLSVSLSFSFSQMKKN